MKDREAQFSPNYVHLKNFRGLMLLLVVFCLQKLWNLILLVMLCKLNTWPQLSRFVYTNAIAFKCIFIPYDRKCFIALHSFFTSVVECSLNQFPCHRHLFVKTVNKQISHAL